MVITCDGTTAIGSVRLHAREIGVLARRSTSTCLFRRLANTLEQVTRNTSSHAVSGSFHPTYVHLNHTIPRAELQVVGDMKATDRASCKPQEFLVLGISPSLILLYARDRAMTALFVFQS